MNLSIASITTAYNAKLTLPRQIDALLKQTRPLQEIVIVDNGSTDGTREMLAERYPQVTVLSLPRNVGAAGGWAAGLTYAALEKGHDWVWNFDDDSVPGETALETMLLSSREAASDPKVCALAPLPVHKETGISYPPLLWRNRLIRPTAEVLKQPVWFADVVIASGCMVRREVVKEVGLPRADFFMDFFDFEYCLRMRSHGYRIAVINACQFAHVLGDTVVRDFGVYKHVWAQHAPWREYYMSRNLIYTCFWLYPTFGAKLFALLHLFRHTIAVLLFGDSKTTIFKRQLQGLIDGWRGKLTVRFVER